MDVELIAHRGGSAIAPENTLAAFSAAIGQKAQAVEFDLQLSADRIPVIIHDATVNRTTDGKGQVKNQTLQELKALDAGAWFGTQFAREQIPTWEEALAILRETPLQIYPEVKQAEYWSTADIDYLVQTLLTQGWQNRCVVASFNAQFLQQVRDRSFEITLGYNVANVSEYTEKMRQAFKSDNSLMLSAYQLLLNHPQLVENARSQGIDVVAWTVDKQENLRQLVELGVVRIVTNSLLDGNSVPPKEG
ncbi:MAG: glycerophosphodiester phosphodiesterase [Cyanobacteria bacterium QS_7_48_42]|jgi:glycerophosphoryl diester phosphodiesterase|nr:MAG: glycerophosphodiester phosphodiesterase [Cyanobacteria bacterium QH_6_48_35]PSO75452.1 MAG: glycerophosphodiester phosphodiesterase [Cyanobacteria bacterium QS_1_48_34]PSO77683.1 MAG: glycerophosphodiester phosphodiesterase [Cyanobacteria bacterium QS_4_48_99]PSP01100.1 MAG: glycerophosphodiester phosphodiesterase [Cyanobacteria bacterium QS_7_48_42]